MSRVLIMSSWTSVGHVGLSATPPVLQALGHEVTQVPTIVLSNHPGWPRFAGQPVAPEQLAGMIDAIDAKGWLDGHHAFLTGYLPSAAHVALACDLVGRLRRHGSPPTVVVDPMLGDEPKGIYLAEEAALAMHDKLVPPVNVLTPNSFELGWLAGRPVTTLADVRTAAAAATRGSECGVALVTSPPIRGDTGVLAVGPDRTSLFRRARCADAPNGAGDTFSALIAAGVTVGAALGHLQALVEASSGADHLRIVRAADRWTRAPAVSSDRFPAAGIEPWRSTSS